MKLIDEIIEVLSSTECKLHDALFKTKVLLHRLGEKELISWVNNELQGYENPEMLPEYRILKVTVMGDISNSAYHYSNQTLPLSHVDKKIRTNLEMMRLTQSIAVIEGYSMNDKDLSITVAPEFIP